jgi:D-alanyl-D-alanine carboxypeptidase/D-alanyl-D-alanine-endopeptidase (penicillin-binding protein 4)
MRRLLLAWLVVSGWAFSAVPQAIANMMSANKIDPSTVSLVIRELKRGDLLASQSPDQPRRPASVMKLLTTYSALLDLGTGFRWPTKFYYTGRFSRGVIHGDLAVEGFGDPTLSSRDLAHIAKRLRRLGVRRITGNLLIDHSFFDAGKRVTSGFDRNRYSEYNAMPDALMLDDHLSRIIVKPQNGSILAYKGIKGDAYTLVNRLKATTETCAGSRAWPRVQIKNTKPYPQVILSGTFSTHCGRRVVSKLLTHPYESFYHAFRSALNRAGIAFEGKMTVGRIPRSARALMIHRARPLLQIVAKTDKKSNNLYARHILLLLGAQREGAPATEAKGAKAVRSILSARGLWSDRIRIDNGCGLSRRSRLTANVLVNLLRDAYRHLGTRWMHALAIAGKDGTIHRRFRHSVAKGRAWMKTGTLNDAKNIAGYVRGKSGKLYAVAILYNGREKWKGSTLQNQVIEWIVRNK